MYSASGNKEEQSNDQTREPVLPNAGHCTVTVLAPDKRQDRQEEEQQEENAGNTNMNTTSTKPASPKEQVVLDPVLEDWKEKGRRGDLRMHRAVAARLAEPKLSLLQALVIGGFRFPTIMNKEQQGRKRKGFPSQAPIYDTDGILLSQRKNQLSRRLRFHVQRKSKNKENKQRKVDDIRDSIPQQQAAAMNAILLSNSYHFHQSPAERNSAYHQSYLFSRPSFSHTPPETTHNNKRDVLPGHILGDTSTIMPNSGRLVHLMGVQQNLPLNSQNGGGYQHHPSPSSRMSLLEGDTTSTTEEAALQLDLMNLLQQQAQQQAQQQQEILASSHTLASLLSHNTSSSISSYTQPPMTSLPSTSTSSSLSPKPFCNNERRNLQGQAELIGLPHQHDNYHNSIAKNPFGGSADEDTAFSLLPHSSTNHLTNLARRKNSTDIRMLNQQAQLLEAATRLHHKAKMEELEFSRQYLSNEFSMWTRRH